MNELILKKYKEGDETKILELFEIVFGFKMTIDYWKWRFIDNPSYFDTMIYLMWDANKLVGHYAVSPNNLIYKEKELFASLSMTTMTHPNYSGKGIFSQLALSLYKEQGQINNLDVIWGFPNNNSHRGFIKNLGWENVVSIPTLKLINTEQFKPEFPNVINEFTEKHEIDYQTCLSGYEVIPNKKSSYLNWRYINHPTKNYSVIELSNRRGFVVVKPYKTNKTIEVDIVEWCIENDLNSSTDIIKAIKGLYESVTCINMWMPLNDLRYGNLEKLGFRHHEPLTYFGFRDNNNIGIKTNNWFYQMGDSDVY